MSSYKTNIKDNALKGIANGARIAQILKNTVNKKTGSKILAVGDAVCIKGLTTVGKLYIVTGKQIGRAHV